MEFFDKIKNIAEKTVKKTGEVADLAAKKGSEVAESVKLNVSLKNEEGKLAKQFCALGKLVYDKADNETVAAQIVEIDDQKQLIEDIKAEIAEKNGKTICQGCGAEVEADSTFCKHCGAKIEKKN